MAHENDRSYVYKGLFYSHIIDTLAWLMQKSNSNLSISSLSLPFSSVNETQAYNAPKSLNRSMLFAKIMARLPFVIEPELKLWLKILDLSKPKVVIAVQPHPMLCKACRERNIQVFDYQHGLINEGMPEYGHVRKMASVEFLPTGYLCWDKNSANVINLWAEDKGIKTFILGNPWMSRFMSPREDDQLVSQELEQFNIDQNKAVLSDDKKVILVTLQANPEIHFPDYFSNKQIIQSSLLEVIKASESTITWLIRLHPIQNRDPIEKKRIMNFFSSYQNVEINHASKVALPALFSIIHGHITWNSCVTDETSNYGIPSFVMDPRFSGNRADFIQIKSFFPNLENSNLVTYANSLSCSTQISEWLDDLKTSQQQKVYVKPFDTNKLLKDVGLEVQEV